MRVAFYRDKKTQGCGISREIFDSGMALPPQTRAFYRFHVYLTVRPVLYQLGSIQSTSALPGDPTFTKSDNHYDVASYKRIERLSLHKRGQPQPWKLEAYSFMCQATQRKQKMRTQRSKGNLISYIEPEDVSQYHRFAPTTACGLTQTIKALVYCILGTQVNVCSSILHQGGRTKEAQSEFLLLL